MDVHALSDSGSTALGFRSKFEPKMDLTVPLPGISKRRLQGRNGLLSGTDICAEKSSIRRGKKNYMVLVRARTTLTSRTIDFFLLIIYAFICLQHHIFGLHTARQYKPK